MHLNLSVPLGCLSVSLAILLFWGIISLDLEDKWVEGDGEHNGIINAVLDMRKDQEVLRNITCLFHFPLSCTLNFQEMRVQDVV